MNEMNPIDAGQGELVNGSPAASSSPTPAESTPSGSPAATSAAQAVAEQLYEVKYGGKTLKVPLSELQSGYSRHQDYTAKTMQLAEDRRAMQAQWESERQQVREFLNKPENVEQLLNYLRSQNPQSGDPNQPLTSQQMQAALSAERMRQAQEQQQMFQELETRQTTATYRNEIDAHLKGLLDANPQLKAIRGVERLLKMSAAEQNPNDLDEAKQYMAQAAQEQLDLLTSHFTQAQKAAVIAKTNLTTKGTEPPGGAAPMPAPINTRAKIGSPEFNSEVAKRLEALTALAR